MSNGITYLQQVTALRAEEAAEDGGSVVTTTSPEQPPPVAGISARPVQDFINDLQRVAPVDGQDRRLTDAVIEKFCEDHFRLDSAEADRVEALLKVAIHSAMEGGLTRAEIVAAVSQVGDAIKGNEAMPAEAYVEAAKITGRDNTHQVMGVAHFLTEMDGGHAPVPAADPSAGRDVHSTVEARYDSVVGSVAQKFK